LDEELLLLVDKEELKEREKEKEMAEEEVLEAQEAAEEEFRQMGEETQYAPFPFCWQASPRESLQERELLKQRDQSWQERRGVERIEETLRVELKLRLGREEEFQQI